MGVIDLPTSTPILDHFTQMNRDWHVYMHHKKNKKLKNYESKYGYS